MQKQVLVRTKQRNATVLVRAEVLSEQNGVMRVIQTGQKNIQEIKASETLPVTKYFGLPRSNGLETRVIQQQLPGVGHGSGQLGTLSSGRKN